jgi:hypothetical protein
MDMEAGAGYTIGGLKYLKDKARNHSSLKEYILSILKSKNISATNILEL